MKTLRHKLPSLSRALPALTTANARLPGDTWMTLRARILQRDGGICRCARCNAMRATDPAHALVAHEVDHVIALDDGGSNDPANLSAINRDCHRLKSELERRARLLRPR